MPPLLVARSHPRHRFAGWWARPLSWLGIPLVAMLGIAGPLWALLVLAFFVAAAIGAVRLRRTRWEIDAPGPDARFRWGVDARRSIRIADLGGVIVAPVPGSSSRGIPVTRDSERWRLIAHDGSTIGVASTMGLDHADVERARTALGVQQLPLPLARELDLLPADTPWLVREPQGAFIATVAGFLAVMALLWVTSSGLTWDALLAG